MQATHSGRYLIRRGLVFDGTGRPGRVCDVELSDGVITRISAEEIPITLNHEVIEAEGQWLMPGFLEIHSHYDAELVTAPGLPESIRHGVTTVVIGNCSLSMVTVDAQDSADLFARVEAIPHQGILDILRQGKTWSTPKGYRDWLEQTPLGPNVAALLGHSDLRVGVLGLDSATRKGLRPNREQMSEMLQILEDALDVGFLGLSTMTTRLDKLAGDRAWSQPLPSTFASWREYRALHRVLRRRDRVLQSAPNAQTQVNIFAFALTSAGLGRRALRTSLLTAMDMKSNSQAHRLTRFAANAVNRVLRGNMRFQALPGPMTVFAEGVQFGSFEDFSSGRTLRNLRTAEDQYALLGDPAFRKRFVKDMSRFLKSGLWHRSFDDAVIINCPDPTVIGRTFEDLSVERSQHPAEVFLDLAMEHRDKLRWRTILGNHRPDVVLQLLASPATQIGFADSGAHLRNLAFYNFGIRALTLAKQAVDSGKDTLTVEEVIRKLTSDLADWWGLDAGRLQVGARADLVLINPNGLDDGAFEISEAPAPDAYGMNRVVNRNDSAVELVFVNGRVAYSRLGGYDEGLGRDRCFGRFLAARAAIEGTQLSQGLVAH